MGTMFSCIFPLIDFYYRQLKRRLAEVESEKEECVFHLETFELNQRLTFQMGYIATSAWTNSLAISLFIYYSYLVIYLYTDM